MKKIILASSNQGKLKEVQLACKALDVTIVAQSELSITSVAETGETFIENALIKAHHVASQHDMPVLADDSGLVVDALAGRPGIYSARYAGSEASDLENIQKLLLDLNNIPRQQRQAHFYCVLVYLRHADDPEPIICQGRWRGLILTEPRGKHGFGYDPIFHVPSHDCSAAQLDMYVKNSMSHRGQALQQFVKYIKGSPD